MKKTIIITILLTLSSCNWFENSWLENARLPHLAFMKIKMPTGTPNFKKGYKDGCATALYARGYGIYRAKYQYSFHPELIDDSEYFFGRKRGYNFCFGYVSGSGHFAKGWDGYIYAQGTAFNMGKGNINDTVIGRASGSAGGKANSVFDTWGSMEGGVGGSLNLLHKNRANEGGVLGGHIFYGKNAKQLNQILGF